MADLAAYSILSVGRCFHGHSDKQQNRNRKGNKENANVIKD